MLVQSSISPATTAAACTCGAPFSGTMVPVSRYAFQRYVRRGLFSCSPSVGVKVYVLPCGCCLWVHATGQRFLCTLPF
jgi:hypothetical protein